MAPSLVLNKFSIGLFGNLFTEELAGRVLSAQSPTQARAACVVAALLFATIGLSPAIIGLWARSTLTHFDLCQAQDQVIGVALQQLLPDKMAGNEHILVSILILESLNTVDTSILMCAKVMASQTRKLVPHAAGVDHAMIVLALSSLAEIIGTRLL